MTCMTHVHPPRNLSVPPSFLPPLFLHSPHYRNRQIALAGLVSAVPTFAAGWKIEIKSGSISVYVERGGLDRKDTTMGNPRTYM